MKKNSLLLLFIFMFFNFAFSQSTLKKHSKTATHQVKKSKVLTSKLIVSSKIKPSKQTIALRQSHAQFLAQSPFKSTLKMSKKERKAMGIPPNKYFESEWELTMDPATGKPNPAKLNEIRAKLITDRQAELTAGRVPGDATDNLWIERGPTNVGGRTRALMFDPNDATKETVFAGGISGGLWKNTNISNSNSTWTRVNIPENLNVSCILHDPITTTTFYVGTGESYTGDASGDGVWKSVNSGATWTKVLGGISGPTTFQSATNLTINSPAGVAGNYAAFPTNPSNFGVAVTTPITAQLVLVNDGTADPTLGCSAPTNNLVGKIALIRRGSCPFVIKVKAAQDAGAIGVIVMNNLPGQPAPMGGTDGTITIPSAAISQSDGNILEAAAISGTISATMNPTTPGFITGNLVPGIQNINDIAVRNNAGTTEIFVAASDGRNTDAGAFIGTPNYGVYKTVDGGVNWQLLTMPLTSNGNRHNPNNIEIGSDNRIWVSTTRSNSFGDGGGKVFVSSNGGASFTDRYTVPNGTRTEVAISSTNPNKLYILADVPSPDGGTTIATVALVSTINSFTSATALTLPVDADTSIPAADFTRGQGFYDLMLEVDPSNDNVLYTGGIDLFKSSDGGLSWNQLSHWYGGFGYQNVHADQHALAFAPGTPSKLLFGNDGGTYFSSNSGTTATSRNRGFNVTQFYSLGVAPTTAVSGLPTGDYFVAGAQDNGSQLFGGVAPGQNASVQAQGGDGAYSMFDQDNGQYYITNYVYNDNINSRLAVAPFTVKTINSETASNGAFIAPMTLDSNRNLLFSDYSTSAGVFQVRRYNNIFGAGVVGKILLTNALLTSAASALTVSKFSTSTTLLIGTRGGKLLRVTSAHLSAVNHVWTDITGPGFVGSISDVEYGSSENEILVTFHNYNVVSIWYTSDAGATWQNKEGNFPDIPVKSILKNPLLSNEAIIGTELGVWYSNNFNTSTPTWNQSFNGMSNVKVTDLDVRNDNMVFAATYGRGVFSGMFTNTTLSNDEFLKQRGITIYPNPSQGDINLNIADYNGKLYIQVYDLNGREVHAITNLDFNLQKEINLNNLQKGLYVVKVSGTELNFTKKIIIN